MASKIHKADVQIKSFSEGFSLIIEKIKKTNRVNKTILILLAFLFLLFILSPERPPHFVTKENSVERAIETALIDKIGAWYNGEPTLITLEANEILAGSEMGGLLLNYAYRSSSSSRNLFLFEMIRTLPFIFGTPALSAVNEVVIRPHRHLVNNLGHEKEVQVGKLVIKRSVAAKVNWDNMTQSMLNELLEREGEISYRE